MIPVDIHLVGCCPVVRRAASEVGKRNRCRHNKDVVIGVSVRGTAHVGRLASGPFLTLAVGREATSRSAFPVPLPVLAGRDFRPYARSGRRVTID